MIDAVCPASLLRACFPTPSHAMLFQSMPDAQCLMPNAQNAIRFQDATDDPVRLMICFTIAAEMCKLILP